MTRPDGALVPGQTVRHIKRGTMYTILARVEVPLDQMADEEIGWMTAEGLHGDDLPMEVAGPFIYRVMVQIDDMTRKSLAIARGAKRFVPGLRTARGRQLLTGSSVLFPAAGGGVHTRPV